MNAIDLPPATLPEDFDGVDAIVVADGDPDRLLAGLLPHARWLRRRIHAGIPYLGLAAGAQIVGSYVCVGGWKDDGRAVASQICAGGHEQICIWPGLGLVGPMVEPHFDSEQRLQRLIVCLQRANLPSGMGIDEDCLVSVDAGSGRTTIHSARSDARIAWVQRVSKRVVITY